MLFNLIAASVNWPNTAFEMNKDKEYINTFINETSFGTEKGLLKIFEGFLIGPAAANASCVGCWPGPGNRAAGAT